MNLKIYPVLRDILSCSATMKSYDIQREVLDRTGMMYSESTITRRLREMGDVGCKRNKYTRSWDYFLTAEKGNG